MFFASRSTSTSNCAALPLAVFLPNVRFANRNGPSSTDVSIFLDSVNMSNTFMCSLLIINIYAFQTIIIVKRVSSIRIIKVCFNNIFIVYALTSLTQVIANAQTTYTSYKLND